jgi:hypothetical protein
VICYKQEDKQIELCGSNNLVETLESYGPPNDF